MIKDIQSVLLKDILKPENVYLENTIKSRAELIKFGASKIHPIVKDFFSLKVLTEHLAEGDRLNMVFDNGLFIPHAKFLDIKTFVASLVITPEGVKDDRSENLIFISFLFLSPLKPSFFQTHLNLLSHVAQIFRKETIDALKNAKSPAEAYEWLTGAEK